MSSYEYQTPQLAADRDPARRGGWHAVNVGHLVMGLAFLGLVAVWGAFQLDLVPDDDLRWVLPLPWVFAGAAGLIASVVASGQRWRRSSQAPTSTYGGSGLDSDGPFDPPDYTSDLEEKLDAADDRRPPREE